MAGRKGEKHWRDAVQLAVNRMVDDGKDTRRALKIIAEKVVTLAMEGDMAAIKEIGDRLDGKAHQSLDTTATVDVRVTEVKDAADEFARLVTNIAERGSAGRGSGKPH